MSLVANCYILRVTSPDGNHDSATSILDLTSDEEEADTRIVLRCLYATHTIMTWTLWYALPFTFTFTVLYTEVGARFDKLAIDCRRYCQLSSTDDGKVDHTFVELS